MISDDLDENIHPDGRFNCFKALSLFSLNLQALLLFWTNHLKTFY